MDELSAWWRTVCRVLFPLSVRELLFIVIPYLRAI